MKTPKKIDIKNDGAYVCMRLAKSNNLKVGDTFSVSPFGTDDTYDLKVAGIYRSTSENVLISDSYAETLKVPRL